MHSWNRILIVFLLALTALPALGADLVSVSTHVSSPTASPGGANHGEVLITNNYTANVRVTLAVRVVYANGMVQQLTGLNDPGTLPPDGGYVQSVYFVIPPDAPPGNASFIADVTASSGGLKERETSSSTFLVTVP